MSTKQYGRIAVMASSLSPGAFTGGLVDDRNRRALFTHKIVAKHHWATPLGVLYYTILNTPEVLYFNDVLIPLNLLCCLSRSAVTMRVLLTLLRVSFTPTLHYSAV